jgi:hypothetical protein
MVARERFELSSMAPKATMLGRYTTGLLALWRFKAGFFLISVLARLLLGLGGFEAVSWPLRPGLRAVACGEVYG